LLVAGYWLLAIPHSAFPIPHWKWFLVPQEDGRQKNANNQQSEVGYESGARFPLSAFRFPFPLFPSRFGP
jgi:hypothetical protein